MLELVNVCKSFGHTSVLKEVSILCKEGEILGILGENGAGKTTCLRILGTVLRPTTGQVLFQGEDVWVDPSRMRRRLGTMVGEAGLYNRLNARENVAYFAALQGMGRERADDRMNELFTALDLEPHLSKPVEQLSKGSKHKVALARALVHDPDIILLDEPTSGLDVRATRHFEELITGLRARGKAVVLSTHMMGQVERICDRVVLIHEGRVIMQSDIEHLKQVGRSLEDTLISLVGDGRE